MCQVLPFDWFTTDHLVSAESTLHQVTGYELRVTPFSAQWRIFLPIATQSCAALFCSRLVKFCFFVTKKTWFKMKNLYFCIGGRGRGRGGGVVWLFEEPRIWTSGFNLRTCVLKSVTATQEHRDMRSGCHAPKIFPIGVRSTVWCLSSLSITSRTWWNRLSL